MDRKMFYHLEAERGNIILCSLLIPVCLGAIFSFPEQVAILFVALCLSIIMTITQTRTLDVCSDGFVVRLCGVAIRKIGWDEVQYIECVTERGAKEKASCSLLFILNGCRSFLASTLHEPGTESYRNRCIQFIFSHPFSVIYYHIPQKKNLEYLQIIKLFHSVTIDRG